MLSIQMGCRGSGRTWSGVVRIEFSWANAIEWAIVVIGVMHRVLPCNIKVLYPK